MKDDIVERIKITLEKGYKIHPVAAEIFSDGVRKLPEDILKELERAMNTGRNPKGWASLEDMYVNYFN